MKIISMYMLVLGLLFSDLAHAQDSKGNGGCPTCQESYNEMLELTTQLVLLGNSRVSSAVPLITDVNRLYMVARDRKVIPAKNAELNDRDALSFAATQTTKLNPKRYSKLPHFKKVALELHELMVLMSIEVDGVYVWSTRLLTLFMNYERLETQTKSFSCSDTQCVLIDPTPMFDRVEKSYVAPAPLLSMLDGVCKLYGLKTALAFTQRTQLNIYRPADYGVGYFDPPVNEINEEGNLQHHSEEVRTSASGGRLVVSSLTCSRI